MGAKERKPVGGPILSGKSFLYMDDCYHPAVLRLVLKESIEPDRLQLAVDQAVRVHPWVLYGIYQEKGQFYYHDGLIKSIRAAKADWRDLPSLGGEGAGGHLLGVYYRDHILLLAFFHGLTDGGGFFSFAEDVLRAYQGEILSPERTIRADAGAEPFEEVYRISEKMALPETSSDGKETGEEESFLVPKRFETGQAQPCHWMLRADAARYMEFAKSCGARPVSVLISAYARAVLRVTGEKGQAVRVAVPVDFRKSLEIPHTFRNCAMPPLMLDIPCETANREFRDLTAAVQKMMDSLLDKEFQVKAVKALADAYGQMPSLPYRQGVGMLAHMDDRPTFTFNASYARRMTGQEFAALVDTAYVTYPAEKDLMVLEMIALPESFCVCLSQGQCTGRYARAFCQVLSENGISCTLEGCLEGNRGYVELREYEQW